MTLATPDVWCVTHGAAKTVQVGKRLECAECLAETQNRLKDHIRKQR